MAVGERIRGTMFGSRHPDFLVKETAPKGPVIIAPPTLIKVGPVHAESESDKHPNWRPMLVVFPELIVP